MQFKTAVTEFKFSFLQGSGQINKINIPIRVELPVAGINDYVQGQLGTYSYSASNGWYRLPTVTDYSLSRVIGELDRPGAIVAAAEGVLPPLSVPTYIRESMERIQAIYELKSIKNKPLNKCFYDAKRYIETHF